MNECIPDNMILIFSQYICLYSLGGDLLTHKTIRYLRDRYDFEYKWLAAIEDVDIPCLIMWGDSDAVAPISIANYLFSRGRGRCELKVLNNVGHFLMLEDGALWMKEVTAFVRKSW